MASQQVGLVMEIDQLMSVLDMGIKFIYEVPTFSVLHIDLRQIKMQINTSDSVFILDGFIRADLELEKKCPPFSVILKEFCFVPVSSVEYNLESRSI